MGRMRRRVMTHSALGLVVAGLALSACGSSEGDVSPTSKGDVTPSTSAQSPLSTEVTCEGRSSVSATFDYAPKGIEPRGVTDAPPNTTPFEAVKAWDEVDEQTGVYVDGAEGQAVAYVVREDRSVSARLDLLEENGVWSLETFDACPSAQPWHHAR